MAQYGEGTLRRIAGKPNVYHISFPLGNGRYSPKFRCKSKTHFDDDKEKARAEAMREARRQFEQWEAAQAREAERAAIEAERGSREQRTVKFFLQSHWGAVKSNYAETTRALYESTQEVHILKDEVFCGLDFYTLTPADVSAFLSRLKGSDHTRRRVFKFLRSAFQVLVEERVLPFNPIHVARAKIPKANQSEVVSFTPEDETGLIFYSRNDPFWYPLVVLAFDSGCRMSELLGLHWDRVDLVGKEIHVHRALHTVRGELILKEVLKTDSSRRTIKIASSTVAALTALKGAGTGLSGYVFNDDGQPITRDAFRHRWEALLTRAGVPHYGFHSCRHTTATRLLKSGMFLTAVSARLGHSKPSMTLDLYSNSIPNDQAALALAFDLMMAKGVLNRPDESQGVPANASQDTSRAVAA